MVGSDLVKPSRLATSRLLVPAKRNLVQSNWTAKPVRRLEPAEERPGGAQAERRHKARVIIFEHFVVAADEVQEFFRRRELQLLQCERVAAGRVGIDIEHR